MKRIQGKRGKGFKNETIKRWIKIKRWRHQNQNKLNSKYYMKRIQGKRGKGFENEITIRQIKITGWKHQNQKE